MSLSPARHSNNNSADSLQGKKIIDLINTSIAQDKPFFSFEYFPPKTEAGVANLYNRMENMSLTEPLFMDITWGAGGSTADLSLDLASTMQKSFGPQVMMHLTCTNMSVAKIREALTIAKDNGVRNILALRGDPPHGKAEWEQLEDGFKYAVDLVKFIRAEFGDWFGIGVAGYPEGHTDSIMKEQDVQYLKDKIDAGADFIVTQLFYDVPLFLNWVKKCREAGIYCPILPGIMPIQSYSGFMRMTNFCKTYVPEEIYKALEPIQQDDAAVRQYGVSLATKMCRELLQNGILGLHLYTMNLQQSCLEILESLGLVVSANQPRRMFPWKTSQSTRRAQTESIRSIFWSNRPNSFLARTTSWDSFPNGRFGSQESPAYGDLSNYHMCPARVGTVEERRHIWGEAPTTALEIYQIFGKFVTGEVKRLPWCEDALALESQILIDRLSQLNKKGFLTINSQPSVNGISSDHKIFGWGPSGGYVYQKAYVEFFVSPAQLHKFIAKVEQHPNLSYCAIDVKGERVSNYHTPNQVTAVTWGAFPNSEIVQPTVVDAASFLVWKQEAFALWLSQWQQIYEPGSTSFDLIQQIHDTYFLVNVVDNDFINGDLFAVFDQLE